MPDVVFKNDTDHAIHIGVWSVWLHCYANSVSPGDSWTAHLASIPYTIEIRAGDEQTHFHENTSGEAVGKIANAYGQGAASVLTAAGWGLGMLGLGGPAARATSGYFTQPAFKTVGGTMDAAIKGGASYFNDKAPGHILTVPQILIDFDQQRFVVRGQGGKVQLWDDRRAYVRGEA